MSATISGLSDEKIISIVDNEVRKRLGAFVREFNKREWTVRIAKTHSFHKYASEVYQHQDQFGHGFVIDGDPIPYFHPNRSFHDEIIWLNKNLYYRTDVSFMDKLVNSAIVKFYGPSRTLDIITGFAKDLPYLTKTERPFIDFRRLKEDNEYALALHQNIEMAFSKGEQIWGTTELRTSLQSASREYSKKNLSPVDVLEGFDPKRKMRPSDMINWVGGIAGELAEFYKTKPDMKQSFEFLTSYRGIGNYYGYHFSSNLARMPGIGSPELIEKEFPGEWRNLVSSDPSLTHGNLDENSSYVMAGPGATATLKRLWPTIAINSNSAMRLLVLIRDHQEEFFGIEDEESLTHLREATELGRFTTFGCEISSCQFNVFERLASDPVKARVRARAPISKEVGSEESNDLEDLFC